jgi:hypothetical protein
MPVDDDDSQTRSRDELIEALLALVEGLRQPVVVAAIIALVMAVVVGDATGIHQACRGRDTKWFRIGTGHAQSRAMRIDDSVLYQEFVAARLRAVELTDAYRELAADDPCRPLLWDGVVSQTERARCLLESWLQAAHVCARVRKVSNSSTVNNPSDFR